MGSGMGMGAEMGAGVVMGDCHFRRAIMIKINLYFQSGSLVKRGGQKGGEFNPFPIPIYNRMEVNPERIIQLCRK